MNLLKDFKTLDLADGYISRLGLVSEKDLDRSLKPALLSDNEALSKLNSCTAVSIGFS
jgi:hypothetical protein